MVIKEYIKMSIYGNKKRRLHIYIPDHLKEGQKCSVLYMFDGHNLFFDEDATYGTSWGLKKYFDRTKYPLIIVGLECNHKGNMRLREFSPYDFTDPHFKEVKSSGKLLMAWMVDELKPYIDKKYPTYIDRKHTFIGGSSMGGLMALYAGIAHSTTYSKALCLSPYTYYVMNGLREDLKNHSINNDTDFYISYGSEECGSFSRFVDYTSQIFELQRLLDQRARLYLHLYKGHYHCERDWAKETKVWVKELKIHKIK